MVKLLIIWAVTILPTHKPIDFFRARVLRFFRFRIGEGTTFCSNVRLKGNVSIGKHCNFNENIMIASTAPGRIQIGDYVIMGPNTVIRNANHAYQSLDTPIRYQGSPVADVVIGDDVWIAANVVIVPGVTIGKGAVIGAGAVVTRDIPDYGVAVGVPARVVKYRGEGVSASKAKGSG